MAASWWSRIASGREPEEISCDRSEEFAESWQWRCWALVAETTCPPDSTRGQPARLRLHRGLAELQASVLEVKLEVKLEARAAERPELSRSIAKRSRHRLTRIFASVRAASSLAAWPSGRGH